MTPTRLLMLALLGCQQAVHAFIPAPHVTGPSRGAAVLYPNNRVSTSVWTTTTTITPSKSIMTMAVTSSPSVGDASIASAPSGGRFVTSKTPANTILITLEEGGNKIGSLEYKEVDTTIPAKEVQVMDLSVSPSYRGKGHGRDLLLYVMEHFLDKRCKISDFSVLSTKESQSFFSKFGFTEVPLSDSPDGRVILKGNLDLALQSFSSYSQSGKHANTSTILNILGRLHHNQGNYEVAADCYTAALELSPNRSAIFQNLGGAFASQGNHQLAFAAFQRAIDLDPNDRYTYFKLGMMYEQLATGKLKEAAEHALKCYEFYLEGEEGREDTDALTIYGNLLQRRLMPDEAIAAYKRALEIRPDLFNVWFNMANAQLKVGKKDDAIDSLRKTLELNSEITAAKHLLKSLTAEREAVVNMDPQYVVELFDYYAASYDDHMKESLLYTAPRILRQEVRKVYNRTLQQEEHIPGTDVLGRLNQSLRILDLGCGTGMCGAWFHDYSNRTVGVDISSKMIEKAKKKTVYDELHVDSIENYLETCQRDGFFDLVIAADVFNYIGDMTGIFEGVRHVMDDKGLLAFTMESFLPDYSTEQSVRTRGFVLTPTGRFAYTRNYVDKMLANAGFVVETVMEFSPRTERGKPAPAYLYVARKKKEESV